MFIAFCKTRGKKKKRILFPGPSPNPSPNPNPKTLTQHWDIIETDQTLTKLFSTPQLSYRREKALSNPLVSAKTLGKVPPPTTNIPLKTSSENYRVKPCHHALCATCPKLLSYHTITSTVTKQPFLRHIKVTINWLEGCEMHTGTNHLREQL